MSINDTIVLFTEPLKHTSFFGAEYIVGLGLIFILMAIVTRDMHKWKTLALPMTVLLHGLGITQHYLIFAISTITFGVSNLSMSVVGNILQSTKKGIYAVGGLTKSATKTAITGIKVEKLTRETAPGTSPIFKTKEAALAQIIKEGKRRKPAKTTIGALYNKATEPRKTKSQKIIENIRAIGKEKRTQGREARRTFLGLEDEIIRKEFEKKAKKIKSKFEE